MKYVKIVSTLIPPGAGRELGGIVGAVSADGTTNTTHWMAGQNPWGFHQDLRFSAPLSAVRQGLRIIEATEKARETGASYIELQDEDHALLVQAVTQPALHEKTIRFTSDIMRALITGGIIDNIVGASNTKPE